jgi:hypothetical protein
MHAATSGISNNYVAGAELVEDAPKLCAIGLAPLAFSR